MAIPNLFITGRSGMMASRAAISTAGHNIANANTEGYSRQRVETEAEAPQSSGRNLIGAGTLISRVSRINDDYIEKQVRTASRDMATFEEKDLLLRQTEDIFNEMNGDGLNRLVARFFNEFRKLSNDPDSEAIRQSVREASQALVNDFHRLRREVDDVRKHVDAKLEGYSGEVNSLSLELKDLNIKIKAATIGGSSPNDLLDKRDVVLKKLSTYADLSMHTDNEGNYMVDIRGVGPLVAGPEVTKFSVERSNADDQGKIDGAFDLKSSANTHGIVTHTIKGGKLGALLETRDQMLSTITDRLDDLAFTMSDAVNDIHAQGFTRSGAQGVGFFKVLESKAGAADLLELSDEVKASVNNIATAGQPDSPGDNRIALAISGIQSMKVMNEGKTGFDDFYNSIVSDVGVASSKNRFGMNQQKDIIQQLGKIREQVSGVSVDEETTNLMQFQHTFDASAKVIQVADEMLKTVLELKR